MPAFGANCRPELRFGAMFFTTGYAPWVSNGHRCRRRTCEHVSKLQVGTLGWGSGTLVDYGLLTTVGWGRYWFSVLAGID